MNPLYNTVDSPNNATAPTKAVNRQGVFVPRNYNEFDFSHHNFKTQHFGLIEPFFYMHGVEKDRLTLYSSHTVRTLPMASPVMSPLYLNKQFFLVPYQAILPKTWEMIYKNPSQGDDVPDDALCLMSPRFSEFLADLIDILMSGGTYKDVLQSLLNAELFFSSGSLLYNLGFKLNPLISDPVGFANLETGPFKDVSFDTLFDMVISELFNEKLYKDDLTFVFDGPSSQRLFTVSNSQKGAYFVSPSQFIELLRESWSQINWRTVPEAPALLNECTYIDDQVSRPINIDKVIAYQVTCMQYFVNPQVDYIYNCDIYRETFNSLFIDAFKQSSFYTPEWLYFTYNGNRYSYDYFSQHYLDKLFSTVDYGLLSYVFGYRSALRFGDYFIDSRTRPYAVGDLDAQVKDNKVSAIDITKNITMQRYLNAVVKLGNNFGDYLRGIFGTTPSPDYHYPKYISETRSVVEGFETANTGEAAQGALVTQLNSSQSNHAYDIEIDMPCIILGLSFFEFPRVYCRTRDRFFFHANRFDFFNPFLQYIGDQEIYQDEKPTYGDVRGTFGYQSRYAEYKQTYSIASGGFVDSLPSWANVVDSPSSNEVIPDTAENQNPDYIRCRTYEFDHFFKSLTGFSLGHRFHFILDYNNQAPCLRAMEVNPNIL